MDFVLPAFDFIGDCFDWGGDDHDLFDDGVDWGGEGGFTCAPKGDGHRIVASDFHNDDENCFAASPVSGDDL